MPSTGHETEEFVHQPRRLLIGGVEDAFFDHHMVQPLDQGFDLAVSIAR